MSEKQNKHLMSRKRAISIMVIGFGGLLLVWAAVVLSEVGAN